MKNVRCLISIIAEFMLVSLFSVSAYSQEHLTFRGIAIDGPVDSVVKNLVDIGYILDECNHVDRATLHGMYGYDEYAVIRVRASCKSNITSSITVEHHKNEVVSLVGSGYYSYFDKYKQKFGEPSYNKRNNGMANAGSRWDIVNKNGDTIGYVSLYTVSIDFKGRCEGIDIEFSDRENSEIYIRERREDDGF